MNIATRLLLAACLVLPFTACKKEEAAAPVEAADVAKTAPTNPEDDGAWKEYISDVVGRNMGNITNTPFVYYLPAQTAEGYEGKYERQLEQATNAMGRGVVSGNLIAFASPDSAKMADLAIASFKGVPEKSMEGVRVLFVGAAADQERVSAAIVPTGSDFVFIEAK